MEFTDEFKNNLDAVQIEKAKTFTTNFKVDYERIENMYEAMAYGSDITDPVQILQQISATLTEEQRETTEAENKRGGKTAQAKQKLNGAAKSANAQVFGGESGVQTVKDVKSIDIFRKIQIEKQQRLLKSKKSDDARRQQQNSMAAHIQNRQSKGVCREIFNSSINKIPGVYNAECQVEVEPLEGCESEAYDHFNLTAQMRTQYLQGQFETLESLFKEDLRQDEFSEFGEPIQDCVRIIGRVINLSTEDPKLTQDCVGLFNLGNADSTTKYRVKLNLSEVPSYSVFEGEVVVAEGFHDSNSKFNVNRLHKLNIRPPQQLYSYEYLKRFNELQQQKPIQCMVAAGPFTQKGDLLYEGLQELMARVRQEMPHVLVILGPFVDGMNEDVQSGVISFRNSTGGLEFLDYADVFTKVMEYIKGELAQIRVKTKLVIVPSAREIHHINPLPQPAYNQAQFPDKMEPILLGNPQMFRINDINIGVINSDVIKDLCVSSLNKSIQGGKIEGCVKSLLQQRSFYPLYPGNSQTPVEWEQFSKMMFPTGVTPDILITPSQLKLFAMAQNTAQNEGVICVNPGTIVKGEAAGSYANITIDPLLLPASNTAGSAIGKKALERVRVDIINV